MPPDSPVSLHPVEAAVARGLVLETQLQETSHPNRWTRLRLVRTTMQPRPLRVVEHWSNEGGTAICRAREMFLADQLIVATAPHVNRTALQSALASNGMQLGKRIDDQHWTVRLLAADLDATPIALARLTTLSDVIMHAEPDGIGFGAGIPNDTSFAQQWNLRNTGQIGGSIAGTDINAPLFWDLIGNASGVTIAVLDSGINFEHPDLQGTVWTNPAEVEGDGIDNDGNGKIDDVRGWDFVNADNHPADDESHGTHVAGIIAATRNNAHGVAGVIGGAKLLPCKILNASNLGTTSDLIAAVSYARHMGVPIMNLSLQNYPVNQILHDELTRCEAAGILLVISAGNQGTNNDTTPNYPSSYPHENIIAVGNHTASNQRAAGSNYGPESIDLFAPGSAIYSTVLGTQFGYKNGTSMAAPHVTALCAALRYAHPTWTAFDIKNAIRDSVIPAQAYIDFCTSGGRLNALAALARVFHAEPTHDSDNDGFANLLEYLAGTRIDSVLNPPAPVNAADNEWLTLSMPRIVRADASLEVQTSTDLITWTTTGVMDSSTPDMLIGSVSLTGQPRIFLRIKASSTP
jgi:subtilisin family serine protease